jgi:hypothetical protein|tara:strand:+ start:470 stop:1705 length:1236 start_codon:yes stop_codon:yes gene_type:complete
MAQRIQKSNSGFLTNKADNSNKLITGTVVFVHIDDTEFESITIPSDISSDVSDLDSTLGFAKIVERGDTSYDYDDLNDYPPFNIDEGLPLLGEVVELIKVGGNSHYKRIHNIDINAGNAVEDAQLRGLPVENTDTNSSGYSETSETGTPNSGGDGDRSNKLGEYFESTQINPLKYFEGDKIIQSRFGQSLRFSGYNNEENVFAPTIILRNRQNDLSIDELKEFEITEEDIVEDGSTIAITSGDYELAFTPGTADIPLETEPIYHVPPDELKGTDQILLNSGRIIISSKDSEMMFFSKGDYSFISDGKLSIDNGLAGAEIDLNGEYRTTTNDNNMYFLGGSGEIYLNTEETTEPLVRGETLLGLLEELIDAINVQIFQTPCGPTAPGPTNKPTFNQIKSKLNTFLSTLNYTE